MPEKVATEPHNIEIILSLLMLLQKVIEIIQIKGFEIHFQFATVTIAEIKPLSGVRNEEKLRGKKKQSPEIALCNCEFQQTHFSFKRITQKIKLNLLESIKGIATTEL